MLVLMRLVRRLPLLLLLALPLAAQVLPSGKFPVKKFEIDPDSLKNLNKALGLDAHPHIPGQCKGAPDFVYAASGDTYYACVNGKDVCSREPNAIAPSLIQQWKADRAKFDADMDRFKADVARRNQMTPEQVRAEQQAEMERWRQAHPPDATPSRPNSYRSSSASGASPKMITVSTGGSLPATWEPAPTKIADHLADGIKAGTTRTDVLKILGEPNAKISGDFERFTYFLESGHTLKIEFENGRVSEIKSVAP